MKKSGGVFSMKKLKERMNYVLKGEDGASNVEIIVWFAVVFVIAAALFLFRDAVTAFVAKVEAKIKGFTVE